MRRGSSARGARGERSRARGRRARAIVHLLRVRRRVRVVAADVPRALAPRARPPRRSRRLRPHAAPRRARIPSPPRARDPRARAARPSSAPDGTPDPAEEHGIAIHPDADARDADVQDASARDDAENAEEAEGAEEDEDEFEYEEVEVEVEVDYTPSTTRATPSNPGAGTWDRNVRILAATHRS